MVELIVKFTVLVEKLLYKIEHGLDRLFDVGYEFFTNGSNEKAKIWAGVALVIIIGTIISVSCALTLYGWYLIPLGFPKITWWQMFWTMVVIRLFLNSGRNQANKVKDDDIAPAVTNLAVMTFAPLLALLIGWIYL